jgi:hypothetical protein
MHRSFVIAVAASLLAGTAFAQYTSPSQSTPSAEAPKAEHHAPAPSTAQAPAARNDQTPATTPQAGSQNRIPPAAEGPQNPAVRTGEGNNASAPVAGANSFTEGEAKSRIEARGFMNVTDLTKDDQGIWRGKAQRDGRQVNVALDYQGNVFGDPS